MALAPNSLIDGSESREREWRPRIRKVLQGVVVYCLVALTRVASLVCSRKRCVMEPNASCLMEVVRSEPVGVMCGALSRYWIF